LGVRVFQASLSVAPIRCFQRHFRASPPSITASEEPTVDTPTALPASSSRRFSAWNKSATIDTQRDSIAAVAGYSSLSIMFLSKVSAISFSASGSIQVVTKVARFSRELPSSISSSWMNRYAAAGSMASSGSRSDGIGSVDNRPV
jgi:hypothetical protein